MPTNGITRAQWVAAALLLLVPTAAPQTEAEVREALDASIGFARENEEARARLEGWGDAIWPTLREMAQRPGSASDLHLISAIADFHTQEAADLLVDILERDGGHPGSLPLSRLRWFSALESTRPLLENARCRSVIVAHAQMTTSWLQRKYVAEIIGIMGWRDDADVVRGMLTHENLEVRRAAAAALEMLTGEVAEIDEPATRFPQAQLDEGLLTRLGTIPAKLARPGTGVGFVEGEGGKGLLAVSCESLGTLLLDEAFHRVATVATARTVDAYQGLPDGAGGTQLVAVIGSPPEGPWVGTTDVCAYALDGSERWRFRVDGGRVRSMAPLFREGAAIGIVIGFGGDTGVVALGLDGKRLWDLPKRHVVSGVDTHSGLTGRVAICGGDLEVVDARGRPIELDESEHAGLEWTDGSRGGRTILRPHGAGHFYDTYGCLFPVADGRLAAISAGSGDGSVTTIVRRSENGATGWQAVVASRVGGMCRIERPGRPRLFAAVTAGGELCLFDEGGTLRHRTTIEAPLTNSIMGTQPQLMVRHMSSGKLGDKSVIVLSLFSETLVYAVSE